MLFALFHLSPEGTGQPDAQCGGFIAHAAWASKPTPIPIATTATEEATRSFRPRFSTLTTRFPQSRHFNFSFMPTQNRGAIRPACPFRRQGVFIVTNPGDPINLAPNHQF